MEAVWEHLHVQYKSWFAILMFAYCKCFAILKLIYTYMSMHASLQAHIGGETILFGRPVRYWTSGALLTGGTCLNQFKGHAVDTQTQKWADSSGRYKTADAAVQSAIHELFNGMKDDGVIF